MTFITISRQVPDHPLSRIFAKQEYCDAFLSGQLRFSHIDVYAKPGRNDKRGDATEGQAEFKQRIEKQMTLHVGAGQHRITQDAQPGIMKVGGEMLHQAYILSCSKYDESTEIEALRERFSDGKKSQWIEIQDVHGFTSLVAESLATSIYAKGIFELQWREVVYTKGDVINPQASSISELSLYQKPRINDTDGMDYSIEREWRLIVLLRNNPAFESYLDPEPFLLQSEDEIDRKICQRIYRNCNEQFLAQISKVKQTQPQIYQKWRDDTAMWKSTIEVQGKRPMTSFLKTHD